MSCTSFPPSSKQYLGNEGRSVWTGTPAGTSLEAGKLNVLSNIVSTCSVQWHFCLLLRNAKKASPEAVAILRNLRVGELSKARRMPVLPIISGFVFPLSLCLYPLLQKLFWLLMVTSFCSVLIRAQVIKLLFFHSIQNAILQLEWKSNCFVRHSEGWAGVALYKLGLDQLLWKPKQPWAKFR